MFFSTGYFHLGDDVNEALTGICNKLKKQIVTCSPYTNSFYKDKKSHLKRKVPHAYRLSLRKFMEK